MALTGKWGLTTSLSTRLVIITLVASTIAVTVLIVGLHGLLAHQTSAQTTSTLHDRAAAAAATVRFGPAGPRVLEARKSSLDEDVWIFDATGHLIDGALPIPALQPAVRRLGRSTRTRTIRVAGRISLYAQPVLSRAGRRGAVVVVGLDREPYEEAENRSLLLAVALGLLVVLGSSGAAFVAARFSLRQVHLMVSRADNWREHELDNRFDLGPPRDELTELADTLDRMLDRISEAIRAERRLTDEVAHELRTPLSVIRSEAQLALMQAHSAQDPAAVALEGIVAATETMNQSITTMLAVARSTYGTEQRCTSSELLAQALERAPRSASVTVRVDVEEGSAPLLIAAPEQVVNAALAPLVDNAVRHASSTVRLSARRQGRSVLILIEDDGDGVTDEELERIFEPGESSAAERSGLGLALARRLARSVGGEVHALGGAHGRFALDLPAV